MFVVAQDNLDIPAPALLPLKGTDGNPTPPFTPDPVSFTDADGRVTTILPPIDIVPPGGSMYVYEDAAAYRARLEKAWTDHALPTYTVTAASGATTSGQLVTVDHTWVPLDFQSATLLSVVEFDITDDTAGPESSTSVVGITGTVYASTTGLYVSAANWGSWWDAPPVRLRWRVFWCCVGLSGSHLSLPG